MTPSSLSLAARSFFAEFQKGRSSVPADSACAAATLAYAANVPNKPSGPNASGMIAYIAEAIFITWFTIEY